MSKVVFEFDGQGDEELERLMEEAGVSTRKDLFNYALSLLKWAIKEKKQGRKIASIDDGKHIKELRLPHRS